MQSLSFSFSFFFHIVVTLICVEDYFSEKFPLTKVLKCMPETKVKDILEYAEDGDHGWCNTKKRK